MSKKKLAKIIVAAAAVTGAAAAAAYISNLKEKKRLEADHPFTGCSAADVPPSAAPAKPVKSNLYTRFGKRWIDAALSFCGLVFLSPLYAAISVAIAADDPGPVLFKQNRVGKDKTLFELHKFRSMKMSTPHDVPTHELSDPDQYITRVGRFLRKTSLDELPQLWDIFRGKMSIIGPRPALWNQEDLIAERDRYGANNVMPGLTGWAQINGRDELEIPVKAKLDGEYVEKQGFGFDFKCFVGTFASVLRSEGVVEGGTGEMQKKLRPGVPAADPTPVFACEKEIAVPEGVEKRVLITGAGSYIGGSFKAYAQTRYPNLHVDEVDTINGEWKETDFSAYDSIYHIAGIAHADIGHVDDGVKETYYRVNTDLAIEVAEKAKREGVRQFILMSSMIVYGESAPYGKKKVITRETVPAPANFYGDSKWQADKGVRALESETFRVAVLRPPMVYGKGSKGNYPVLAGLAGKLPLFPCVHNERSMLYIGNLCEFLCKLVMSGENGVFFPQNGEYSETGELVKEIAAAKGKKIKLTGLLNPAVRLASFVPGKIGGLVNKAFGNSCYDQNLSDYGFSYRICSLKESIKLTETGDDPSGKDKRKHILLISQYFYPETFRVNDMAAEWVKRGYRVTVLTGIPNYPMGKFFDGYDYFHKRTEKWNGVDIIRIPLIARGNSANKLLNATGMAANYLSFIAAGKRWVSKNDIGADLVFTVEVSPMTQALIGVWYGERYRVPTYLYVQDLWPENVETVTGIHSGAVLGPIDRMVDKIYRETDQIFTTSPSFVEAIINRKTPVKREKVHYWPQYAEEFYRPLERRKIEEIPDDGAFRIAFTGNVGTAQGLDVLPRAAALLKEENLRFVIVGDGRYQAELERQIDRLGVRDMFIMIPRVPAERVPEILSACDAGFISFNKTPLWEMTIPAKLQSYMACGKAIIASASGETKRIIDEAQCGLCCELGDAEALAEGIRRMIRSDCADMGRRARTYFEAHFEKKKLMDQMDELLMK